VARVSTDERTLTVTWSDPMPPLERSREMAGGDYLRAIADGSVPPPPDARTLGMGMDSVDEGAAPRSTSTSAT
jgi:hypothetical protein